MASPQKILIIEDDKFLGGILKQKLITAGYETEWEIDGKEGFQAISRIMPDLILLDIILPSMNGYEILEAKIKDPVIKEIPVVIVSNSGQPVEISRVLELGVKDYLVKAQFDPEDVLVKVKTQLRQANYKESTATSIGSKKIMWVEDDAMLSDIIGRKLAIEGCNLIHMSTGEEAIAAVEREMPDIIMLDIILPSIGGIEVLEKIKSMPQVASIPIILLSNLNQKGEEERALKLGATKFLTKATLSLNEIIEEIKQVLYTAGGK